MPIIHSEADMGALGPALARLSQETLGGPVWSLHQRVVCRYWEAVSAFLLSLEAGRLRLYQDGLPVGGRLALRVVEGAAGMGSPNYALLLELVSRGARLEQTEDPGLLEQERWRVAGAVSGPGGLETSRSAGEGAGEGEMLVTARDRFIARRIGATLEGGELGALFIGASHRVWRYLAPDIRVEFVKEPSAVDGYFRALAGRRGLRSLEGLATALTAPVVAERDQPLGPS